MKRKEFREGKTKGNTKPLPKGPRPDIGPPPPQYPKSKSNVYDSLPNVCLCQCRSCRRPNS